MQFSDLRFLSFDDLFLLSYLKDGFSVTECAGQLGLTQPAVSQRVRKLGQVFRVDILKKQGRKSILTDEGHHLASRAKDVISIFRPLQHNSLNPQVARQTIRIGTRAEVGRSWLWPVLKKLRRKSPELHIHVGFGSGPELLAGLSGGEYDAVLTSSPVTMRDFDCIELSEEDYVFCASSKLARTISKTEDIRHHTWIEHDRSFPFLHYLASKERIKLKMEHVWFVGSSEIMVDAILSDLGVGIVPGYIFRRYPKKLVQPLPRWKLQSDRFRIVYNRAKPITEGLHALSGMMLREGLG